MGDMTTIRIPVSVRDDLKDLRLVEEEPMYRVIQRLIEPKRSIIDEARKQAAEEAKKDA